jgi:hypothetical protein
MERIFLMAVLFCGVCRANPLPVAFPAEDRVYMASEHLTVSVSPDVAEINGKFTFNYQPGVPHGTSIMLEVPIWFPEVDPEDQSVAEFWKCFRKDRGFDEIKPQERAVLEKALGLRVTLGSHPVSLDSFFTLTSTNRIQKWAPRDWQQETGFCCLVFDFYFTTPAPLTEKPLEISYRQPLLLCKGEREFFYLPVLQNLPKDIAIDDTSRYAITVVPKPSCSLIVRNGSQDKIVRAGYIYPRISNPT